ncbi:MAG: sodium-dependent transporter [Aquisalimonadaceae bacterium]
MPVPRRSLQGEWSSHSLFILALAGASIGFGNLWRFPELVVAHGGGAFLLLYMICLLLLSIPLLLAEILIGRGAHQAPVQAYRGLSRVHGGHPQWALAGGIAILGAILLLSVLSVVAGWALGYLFRMLGGALERMDVVDAMALFQGISGDVERSLAWQMMFLAMVMAVVMRGLSLGIEPFVRVGVPMLLLGMIALLVLVMGLPESGAALRQVFAADVGQLDGDAVRAALRHGFFSLALGVGVAGAYGAYLSDRVPLVASTVLVVVLDTLVALAAAVVVVTLLAAGNIGMQSGTGLMFETLPMVLSGLAGGSYMAVLLFTVLALAALTTGIALMEPVVAWLVERGRVRRPAATLLTGVMVWVLGVIGVYSVAGQGWYPLAAMPGFGTATMFDLLNQLATLIVLPLAALAAVVFVGWAIPRESVLFGLGWRESRLFGPCYFVLRFVAPLLLLAVLLDGLGLIGNAGGE